MIFMNMNYNTDCNDEPGENFACYCEINSQHIVAG